MIVSRDAFGRAADGTPIPGQVRRSNRARRIFINVRAELVELVVPARASIHGPGGALAFLQAKQAWIERAWARIQGRVSDRKKAQPYPQRFEDGAMVLHRGEYMALTIREEDIRRPLVEEFNGLLVTVPRRLTDTGRERMVALAVRSWARSGLLSESRRLAKGYAARLGLTVADVRLSKARTRWGSCSAKGVIRVNVALATAPPALLEYLVAHEVAHIRCRGHGPRFYATLGRLVPDWEERRRRLRAFERECPSGLSG